MIHNAPPLTSTQILTVELAFGDAPFVTAPLISKPGGPALADDTTPFDLPGVGLGRRVAAGSSLWPKENLINQGRSLIPDKPGQHFYAWIDADLTFANRGWVEAVARALALRPGFCQLFER
jgi:hypothetical protein